MKLSDLLDVLTCTSVFDILITDNAPTSSKDRCVTYHNLTKSRVKNKFPELLSRNIKNIYTSENCQKMINLSIMLEGK